MYRIPDDLDLSPVVGESTTQLRVGQFGPPVHVRAASVSLCGLRWTLSVMGSSWLIGNQAGGQTLGSTTS